MRISDWSSDVCSSDLNLNLQPETADTWTLGVVFQPDFLPRFNLSLDYYNIKINDVLGTPLPGDIIAACFDNITAASASDPACTSIRSEEHTSELPSLMRISNAVLCLKKQTTQHHSTK